MVEEMYAHQGAGIRHFPCHGVVFAAWPDASAGVIVRKCYDGSVGLQRLLDDKSHVNGRLRQSAVRHPDE